MLTVVLTRHGGTTRSSPEQHLGQHLDVPLSEEGRAQAVALGRRLAGVGFDRVVASPLQRAVETARLIVPGREPETDPRLLEMDYGAWEGLTYERIAARDGAARLLWEADPASLACPGGESGNDVAARVRSFLQSAIEQVEGAEPPAAASHAEPPAAASHAEPPAAASDAEPPAAASHAEPPDATEPDTDHRILVVGHSTTDRIFLCVALGVPVRDYRRRFIQQPANLTVLRFIGPRGTGAQALVVNDVGHLRGLEGATWD